MSIARADFDPATITSHVAELTDPTYPTFTCSGGSPQTVYGWIMRGADLGEDLRRAEFRFSARDGGGRDGATKPVYNFVQDVCVTHTSARRRSRSRLLARRLTQWRFPTSQCRRGGHPAITPASHIITTPGSTDVSTLGVPPGRDVRVELMSGGGGGAACNDSTTPGGGGGGGGAYCMVRVPAALWALGGTLVVGGGGAGARPRRTMGRMVPTQY